MALSLNRRTFLKSTLASLAGLTLGIDLSGCSKPTKLLTSRFVTHWLNISPENIVTVIISRNEMGQGIATGLAMVIAEELEADWAKVRFEFQPEVRDYVVAKEADYGTVDSMSMKSGYLPMRQAGAAAREMLLTACARRWRVQRSTLTTRDGIIYHPDHDGITYGELAVAAHDLPVPRNPVLKDPAQFRLIGKPLARLDSREHIEGKPVFGIDVVVPGMLHAAVVQSPVIGGEVLNLDQVQASSRGVTAILPISHGVAVVAESWWEATKTAEALEIQFSIPAGRENLSSESISRHMAGAMRERGRRCRRRGNPETVLASAQTRASASFETPFYDHAALEPMNCTAHVSATRCEIWVPTQWARGVLETARQITGLPEESITIHPTFLGGGFGRKDKLDYINNALLVSQSLRRPVKVIWSREEDMRHGYYKSVARAELSGAVDADGKISSWMAKLAAPKMGRHWFNLSLACFIDLPYAIPNLAINWIPYMTPVRKGFMRSVNMFHNCFFVESFVDELASLCASDPVAFRLRHLEDNPRARVVLERAAELAGWGRPGPARGVALFDFSAHDKRRTVVAHIAEAGRDEEGKITISKVHCVIDCGRVVNPDLVKAQVEGGTLFGLTGALLGEITLQDGQIEQSNFNDYPLLSMKEAPQVEVEIIPSTVEPSGAGEYGVPGIIPAAANAIFQLTGQRIRRLPFYKHGFTAATAAK